MQKSRQLLRSDRTIGVAELNSYIALCKLVKLNREAIRFEVQIKQDGSLTARSKIDFLLTIMNSS